MRPTRIGTGLGIDEVLGPHREFILRLASELGGRNVRVFGSVRRKEATSHSDVDLLVEWSERTSLRQIARFQTRVEDKVGRRVDVLEPGQLHWAMAPQVLAEAVNL